MPQPSMAGQCWSSFPPQATAFQVVNKGHIVPAFPISWSRIPTILSNPHWEIHWKSPDVRAEDSDSAQGQDLLCQHRQHRSILTWVATVVGCISICSLINQCLVDPHDFFARNWCLPFLCVSMFFFYICIYIYYIYIYIIYIYMQPIFGGTLRLWGSNLTFLHRLVACLASQEWDQPMREYIQTIRAGKGEGHQLIQVIWVSFDKLDFWDYKQVGWFFLKKW